MEAKTAPYLNFEYEQIYYLFTRACGSELLFRNQNNYNYFLKLVSKYLMPYLEIYAYCLVPQRLGFLVNFRSSTEIFNHLKEPEREMLPDEIHKFLMQPISNLLNSYSKSYNKMYQRKGALFIDYIKREQLDNVEDLKEIFREIHHFPIQHQLIKTLEDWKFSSYNAYVEPNKTTKISIDFMMDLFENVEDLKQFHKIK